MPPPRSSMWRGGGFLTGCVRFQSLRNFSKGHMKKMTGRGPKNRDIDQALYTWYCERKASGNRPKSCHVQSKARELYLTCGYNDMKCSYGWFKRWSQRFQ